MGVMFLLLQCSLTRNFEHKIGRRAQSEISSKTDIKENYTYLSVDGPPDLTGWEVAHRGRTNQVVVGRWPQTPAIDESVLRVLLDVGCWCCCWILLCHCNKIGRNNYALWITMVFLETGHCAHVQFVQGTKDNVNVRSTSSSPRNLAFKYCRIKHPHQLEIAYQDSILRPKKILDLIRLYLKKVW